MATPNTLPETAIELLGFPVGWYLVVNDLSQPYRTWYKYTPIVGDSMLSILPYAVEGSTFYPQINTWVGTPHGTVYAYNLFGWPVDFAGFVKNGPTVSTIPLTPGIPVYIELRNTGTGTLVHAAFEILFKINARATAPTGSFLITDDTQEWPASLVDTSTGEVLWYLPTPASGENGLTLPAPDGRIIHEILGTDLAPRALGFFTPEFEEYARWEFPMESAVGATGLIDTVTYAAAGLWYDANHDIYLALDPFGTTAGQNVRIYKFNPDTGTQIGVHQTLPYQATSNGAMGINPAGTIAYLMTSVSATALKRWDLVNKVSLTDLPTFPAPYTALRDVIVLPNGELLVPMDRTSAPVDWRVIRYSATGTVLQTYLMGSEVGFGRIALDPNDLNTMWAFTKESTGEFRVRWVSVNLTTGVQTSPVLASSTFSGDSAYQDTVPPANQAPFGISTSCPIMITPVPIVPPTEEEEEEVFAPAVVPKHECTCDPAPSTPEVGPVPEPEPIMQFIEQCEGDGVVPSGELGTLGDDNWAL